MNNDLISRSALKNALNYIYDCAYIDSKSKEGIASDIIAEIDNAPTVEPKLKDAIIEAFNLITDQEFEHSDSFWIVTPKGKKIEFEKKRQKGDWIENKGKDIRDHFYTCSICGRTINVICGETLKDYPFCHCGAEMRGDTE